MTIDMVIILLGLALIPAFIASSKGRSFALWYIYGVCPHCRRELPQPDPQAVEDLVKCRTCGMMVKKGAKYCPRCGNLID